MSKVFDTVTHSNTIEESVLFVRSISRLSKPSSWISEITVCDGETEKGCAVIIENDNAKTNAAKVVL